MFLKNLNVPKSALEDTVADEATEPVPFYSHVHSCSVNFRAHPVDFLQATNEIPETNFVTNHKQPQGQAAAPTDPLSQTQFLVKLAEHNLLDHEIHGGMLPYGAFPKN